MSRHNLQFRFHYHPLPADLATTESTSKSHGYRRARAPRKPAPGYCLRREYIDDFPLPVRRVLLRKLYSRAIHEEKNYDNDRWIPLRGQVKPRLRFLSNVEPLAEVPCFLKTLRVGYALFFDRFATRFNYLS